MSATYSLYQHYLNHRTVCTDTRAITKDCLFFALRGDRFNANEFAAQALKEGAAYAIIDDQQYHTDERCILVPDVLTALQDLARQHRQQLDIPVIGLTGSNGKTTTKELIKAILSEKYRTFATSGNLNNHIGVPLSILSITGDKEIAVIEMGANHQKEIELLCSIALPEYGLITNVGMAHLDGFGGFEGVKKGKAELYAHLKQHQGKAFINRDNTHLLEMSQTAQLADVIYYGSKRSNTISGELDSTDPFLELSWQKQGSEFSVSTQLTGAYNFENILAAICVGDYFSLTPEQINKGLSGYAPQNNRSQITKTENNTVICDFYNANPSSMNAALKNMDSLHAANKVAIIGDMFELGSESAEQHLQIILQATAMPLDTLIFIGKHFHQAGTGHKGHYFENREDAAVYLQQHALKESLILLKGSRGMALEQLLPLL